MFPACLSACGDNYCNVVISYAESRRTTILCLLLLWAPVSTGRGLSQLHIYALWLWFANDIGISWRSCWAILLTFCALHASPRMATVTACSAIIVRLSSAHFLLSLRTRHWRAWHFRSIRERDTLLLLDRNASTHGLSGQSNFQLDNGNAMQQAIQHFIFFSANTKIKDYKQDTGLECTELIIRRHCVLF